ncbi:J domain-containing protein [Pontibacter fetidus]|uniref:DnaJ domain-containing protein n=1 Tax=Pontibacter fetidus TaxID=2700082 RepID=A0A6B2H3E0_9BACT|nr:DnaJ domain-containing protein [Pontibacter fetidus]NDK56921.1 DnaJ domain-containing protein [Pontibacter fetidus]
MKNYYRILNISRSESPEGVKKAYRQAVLFWHPDKNSSANAHEKFIEVNEAYNILIDLEKRRVYDELFDSYNRPTAIQQSPQTQQESKYKTYESWVKEERLKAEKLAKVSIDNLLTESFHFLDKYGMVIIFAFIGLFMLVAIAITD